jgi:hypothetical protein
MVRFTSMFAVAMLIALSQFVQPLSATITFDATGTDPAFVPATNSGPGIDFWGIQFDSGAGFIESVRFDITVVSNIYFDFDGSEGGATAPIFGPLVGLNVGDISHSWSNLVAGPGTPAILDLTFDPGTFEAGDSLRFSMDVDGWMLGTPLDPGGEFGIVGMPVSVSMYGGSAGSAPFVEVISEQAIAVVEIVPEPTALILAGIGLSLIAMRRKR